MSVDIRKYKIHDIADDIDHLYDEVINLNDKAPQFRKGGVRDWVSQREAKVAKLKNQLSNCGSPATNLASVQASNRHFKDKKETRLKEIEEYLQLFKRRYVNAQGEVIEGKENVHQRLLSTPQDLR